MQNVGVMTNSRRGKTKEIEGKLIVGAAGIPARSTAARNSASYGSLQWRACQNSLILKKSQSPDFHKPGLCYV